jgi:hypothetical protein
VLCGVRGGGAVAMLMMRHGEDELLTGKVTGLFCEAARESLGYGFCVGM